MHQSAKSEVVVVTGASAGLGRAIAREFGRHGAGGPPPCWTLPHAGRDNLAHPNDSTGARMAHFDFFPIRFRMPAPGPGEATPLTSFPPSRPGISCA